MPLEAKNVDSPDERREFVDKDTPTSFTCTPAPTAAGSSSPVGGGPSTSSRSPARIAAKRTTAATLSRAA